MLLVASSLIVLIGIAHSYLGEKYIIIRLLRYEKLPKLFGDDSFTRLTLRFAWHITTLAWFGFAYLLITLNSGLDLKQTLVSTTAFVFFLSALLSLVFTRGRHLSWLVFLTIALLCWLSL